MILIIRQKLFFFCLILFLGTGMCSGLTTAASGPDLVGIRMFFPSVVQIGQHVVFQDVIKNQGDSAADEFIVHYSLTSDPTITGDDLLIDSWKGDTVPPGAVRMHNASIVLPDTFRAGPYYLIRHIDPAHDIAGEYSGNNVQRTKYPIDIQKNSNQEMIETEISSPEGVDIIDISTETPQEAYIGDSFLIMDTIKNIGGSPADIVRIDYGLSSYVDGKNSRHIGWWTSMNLKPDQPINKQNSAAIPSDLHPGYYYLTKKINVISSASDLNKGNSLWVSNQPIYIRYNPSDPLPELTHVQTIWPAGQPGESVIITDTITNTGRSCATNVGVGYYLSPNQELDIASAQYLGVWNLDSLCPGEQKTNSVSVTIPQGLTAEEYYLYSVIDPCSFMPDCGSDFPELDKKNNINRGILHLEPYIFMATSNGD